jgi:hypothetical protein
MPLLVITIANKRTRSKESRPWLNKYRPVQTAIVMSRAELAQGYREGWVGRDIREFSLHLHPNEETIVELIRNLCEIAQEGWLSEELLRRDAGIIAGWISKQAFPLSVI